MGNCLFGKILKFCHLRAHVLGPEHGCLGPCSQSRAWMLGTMFSVQSMDAWDRRKALMSDGGMRFESNQQYCRC